MKTDIHCYYKVSELRDRIIYKDSIILIQENQIKTDSVFIDSLKFELNHAIVSGNNLEANYKKDLNKNAFFDKLKNGAIIILSTTTLIGWGMFLLKP